MVARLQNEMARWFRDWYKTAKSLKLVGGDTRILAWDSWTLRIELSSSDTDVSDVNKPIFFKVVVWNWKTFFLSVV